MMNQLASWGFFGERLLSRPFRVEYCLSWLEKGDQVKQIAFRMEDRDHEGQARVVETMDYQFLLFIRENKAKNKTKQNVNTVRT